MRAFFDSCSVRQQPSMVSRLRCRSVKPVRLNYCLKALMEKGLVKMKNFANSKNKFGYIYVINLLGLAEKSRLTNKFLQRKLREYEVIKEDIEAIKKSWIKKEHS